ncbi:MAG: HAD family hydrolase [Chloroflexota bacterium]
MVKYEAVIFDLFGTLVKNFKRQEYDQVNAKMAELLNIPFSEFWNLVAETGHGYYLGHYQLFEDNLEEICKRWGEKSDTDRINQAAQHHYEFVRGVIVPSKEVLDSLENMKKQGLRIGLITNCGAAVPILWEQSPLGRLIDIAVFSCEEHVMKPDIAIYQATALRLNVQPEACIYVGDGSYNELTNAAAAGMFPILKRTELDDVYDNQRPEVENWSGLAIDEISELMDIVNELEA